MSSRATKWNGIETVLNAYGIDARDIMYFGDNYDDIEPIMRSGFGVAVSNAIEEVKEIADCIIDSNENDGMAKYINETRYEEFFMRKPKMILFDYGQTLVAEDGFDGVKGTIAVMRHAIQNKYNMTPERIQQEANAINRELKRFDPKARAQNIVEIPNHMFTAYLYESMGIRIDLPADEIDRIFWDAASPGKPTPGIKGFLDYLWTNEIRTAVLSNISYAGAVVSERINRLLPDNHFEFILASSEVLFRKPHPRIFRLALEKAALKPEEVWYVGDNYDCDVAGAHNSRLTPIWYKGALDFEQADHKDVIHIHAWSELQEMIEQR